MAHNATDGEQRVARLVKQGDTAAMKELYERSAGFLAAVCSRYIPADDDVKDVLHDSFLKIFTSMRTFEYRGPGSLRAWMTRIVVNEALNFLRRTSQSPAVHLDSDLPDIADEPQPDVSALTADELHALVRSLPRGYRTVFNLYVFERRSHKEIAALLGISEGTSASQLHKAKNMLAKKINEHNSANNGRAMD